jgi:hypothetical protein
LALKRSIVWIDAGGRTRQTIPCTSSGASSIMAALQNHSEAAVEEWWEGFANFLFPLPTGGRYADVADFARLTFSDSSGSLANLTLPAPSASIFLPDGSTVDSSAIADVITAAIGNLCSEGGGTVSSYVAGMRVRHNPRD